LIEDNKGVIRNRYSKEQTIQWPKKDEQTTQRTKKEGTDNTMAKKRRNRQYNGQKKDKMIKDKQLSTTL
jgi:hypothetical protein